MVGRASLDDARIADQPGGIGEDVVEALLRGAMRDDFFGEHEVTMLPS